jgi:DNA polymerase III epsilon subunit-like protein
MGGRYTEHAVRLLATGSPVLVYDTETTGLPSETGPLPKIWEIASIRIDRRGGREEKRATINIGELIPAEALVAGKGLDPALPMTEGKEPSLVWSRFAAYAGDAIFVGHNILKFDNPLAAAACSRLGIAPPIQLLDPSLCIDTMLLAQELYPKGRTGSPENHRLSTLASFFSIERPDGLHRALVDTRLTELVFRELAGRIGATPID